MSEQPAKFQRLEQIGNNTFELFIKPTADFSFTPGQYVSIILPQLESDHPREAFRDFSLSSSSLDTSSVSVIFRDSNSVFKTELKNMQPGDKLLLEGPSGNFTLDNQAKVLWIAGGIGITPLLSMVRSGLIKNRDIQLIYVNSKDADVIGRRVLEGASLDTVFLTGRKSMDTIELVDKDMVVMVSGPPDMVAYTTTHLVRSGHTADKIRTEGFAGYDII